MNLRYTLRAADADGTASVRVRGKAQDHVAPRFPGVRFDLQVEALFRFVPGDPQHLLTADFSARTPAGDEPIAIASEGRSILDSLRVSGGTGS